LIGFEGSQKAGYALHQSIVDLTFILESLDLQSALLALGVDLVLLGADEGSLIDIGVDLDVGIIAELQIVLRRKASSALGQAA
jgi:hypothetical protein